MTFIPSFKKLGQNIFSPKFALIKGIAACFLTDVYDMVSQSCVQLIREFFGFVPITFFATFLSHCRKMFV